MASIPSYTIDVTDRVPVLLVLLDTVPDYIQKTFGVDENFHATNDGEVYRVVHEGEVIPDNMQFAIILYNRDSYHYEAVVGLQKQIDQIAPNARVMWLPVRG